MSKLLAVGPEYRTDQIADVVFVHGLGGHYHETWQSDPNDASTFWPLWLAQDLNRANFWTLDYDAAISGWIGSGMNLADRGANLVALLETKGVGTRPLIFVCHSLGGLVSKQIVRTSQRMLGSGDAGLSENCRAIVFLATPHSGSQNANWLAKFRKFLLGTEVVEDLKNNSSQLRDLNGWFRSYVERNDVRVQSYFETKTTNGIRIVDPKSAEGGFVGSEAIPVDADHFSICKPKSKQDLIYLRVQALTERVLAPLPQNVGEAIDVESAPSAWEESKISLGAGMKAGAANVSSHPNNTGSKNIRRILVKTLGLEELGNIWFDTFDTEMNEACPNKPISDCVRIAITNARKRNLLDTFLENVIYERPDLKLALRSAKMEN